MKLGLDFDHTLICYDSVLRAEAIRRGLLPADWTNGGKREMRDVIRARPDGDLAWQRLQSHLYAEGILQAAASPGLAALFSFIRENEIEAWIVSHKTDIAPFDRKGRSLRDVALQWMEREGFFETERTGLSRERVIFADTKEMKLRRISELGITVFVDDLEEILLHRDFPPACRKILFGTQDHPLPGVDAQAATWSEVAASLQRLRAEEKICPVFSRLGCAPSSAVQVQGGRNSRCFRVAGGASPRGAVFLKQYFKHPRDPRDRLGTEVKAVEFLRSHGVSCVPHLLFAEEASGAAAYTFIEGEPALARATSAADIDALLAFLRQLHAFRLHPLAGIFAPASEAFFSANGIVENLHRRRRRFTDASHAELQSFLRYVFDPVFEEIVNDVRADLQSAGVGFGDELPSECWTLSPSDIGFHNAIRRANGELVFIDFEYFGWDDPAKLISDFLLQPEQNLNDELRARFLRGAMALYPDRGLPARLDVYLRLFRLKWVMILLNEFLRDDRARRDFSGSALPGSPDTLSRQLAKARLMLAPLQENQTSLSLS